MKLTDKWMQRGALSDRPQVAVDDTPLARGALEARIGKRPARGGAATRSFYFRYTAANGKQDRLPIGDYDCAGESDPGAMPGGRLTLVGARRRAHLLADLVHRGESDMRLYFERQRRTAEEERRAVQEAALAEAAAVERGSLRKLVEAYLGGLDASAKPSAKDARNTMELHVIQAHPELVVRKAAELTPSDLRPVFAKLVESGKGRTAAKLRSYLHAAYKRAAEAEHNPAAPVSLLGFGIASNPVALIPTLSEFNRVGERVLSEAELGAYVRELMAIRSSFGVKAALFLSLLLGGQRPGQLLRVQAGDVDLDEGIVTLRDAKGRRRQARLHVLPLTQLTNEAFDELLKRDRRVPVVFSAYGKAPVMPETLSKTVTEISLQMVGNGTATAAFKLADIRRTCETHMARLGIGREIRAQLQSHGMGNIIDRHYLRHLFLDEKRAALVMWERELQRLALTTPSTRHTAAVLAESTPA